LCQCLVWHVVLFFILSVGLSRIYLGVHFPYQVGAGYVVGFMTLIFLSAYSTYFGPIFNQWISSLSLLNVILFWFVVSTFMFIIAIICYVGVVHLGPDTSYWNQIGSLQCPLPVVDPRQTYFDMCSFSGALFGAMLGDTLARYYIPHTWYRCVGPLSQWIRMILALAIAIGIIEVWGLESTDGSIAICVIFRQLLRYAVTTFVIFYFVPLVSSQVRKCVGYNLQHDLMSVEEV